MGKKIKSSISMMSAFTLALGTMGSLPVGTEIKAASDDMTSFPYTIEGENLEGADLWTSIYNDEIPDYSGEGFAYLTNADLSFEVTVPEDAMYSISVRGAQILNEGGRLQTVVVNGVEYSKTIPYANKWIDFDMGIVRLKKGKNTLKFISKYGYMAIDKVTVSEAEFPDLSKASDTPVDADATPETKALMKYLKSVYGNGILSGQQEIYGGGHSVSTSIRFDAEKNICVDGDGKTYSIGDQQVETADDGSKFVWHCYDETGFEYTYDSQNRNYGYNDYDYEMKYIEKTTGKLPAIRGFDFGSYCPCYAWDDGVAKRMIDWAKNKNGIITASWHVNVPTTMADYTLGEPLAFEKTTYTNKTDFVTANCMVKGTAEYDYFQLCMENLANELLKLQDAGVPIIFRPLHEAEGNPSNTADPIDGSGAWFWWSKEGAKVYNELWAFLQDTLTEKYGLHNIIWEQNLYAWSDSSAAWYSGDDRVDIVGFDKYNVNYNRHDGKQGGSGPNLDSEAGIFYSLNGYVDGKKMVAMPENDSVPALENIMVEHAKWLYFCPWYDSEQEPFVSGEKYQDVDVFTELYQSDYCITLDELPKDLYGAGGTTDPTTKPTQSTEPTTGGDVVYGDANEDGEVTIDDAVLIMQAIANADKYGVGGSDPNAITEQGKRNADCFEPGSDLTAKDALTVQKYLLGSLKWLPEAYNED